MEKINSKTLSDDLFANPIQKPTGDVALIKGIQVVTNFVRLHILNPFEIFKYSVEFSPELTSPKRRCLAFQQLHHLLRPLYLYDDVGNILFLPVCIEKLVSDAGASSNDTVNVHTFKVKMPYLETLDVGLRISIKAIPIGDATTFFTSLIRMGMNMIGYDRFIDGFYDTITPIPDYDIVIHSGIRFGTRKNDSGLLVWIDPSSVVWRKDTLLDFISLFKDSVDEEEESERRSLFEGFIISRVIFSPTRTTSYFPVHGIRWDLNPTSTFTYFGQEMSFAEYYKDYCGIQIQDLTQPLLITRKENLKTLRLGEPYPDFYECYHPYIETSSELLVVHIPELCHLSEIISQCKEDNSLGSQVLKHVNPSPQKINSIVMSYLKHALGNKICTKLFRQWNVELESSLLSVEGRVLPGPKIRMNAYTLLDFSNADEFLEHHLQFQKLAGSVPFYSTVPLLHWILICKDEDKELAIKFEEIFQRESQKLQMEFPSVKAVSEIVTVSKPCNPEKNLADGFVDALRHYLVEGKPQFVVFIVPRQNNGSVYQAMKQACCIELGIVSQAVKPSSITAKGVVGIIRKIAIQINVKMGGASWAFDSGDSKEAIMLVGIDTHHRGKMRGSEYSEDSVLAAVFTLNPECTKLYTRVVCQRPMQETGDSFATMFFDAYVEFYKECGRWPTRIVVFRDGISNAYLHLLQAHEIVQMRRSLELIEPRPKLVVILIQKHTTDRFFINHNERILNPMPGTIIDHTITRTEFQDFYLFSQMFRGKGSGQPTRCVVLEDETQDINFLQTVTYASSFVYFNWAGSLRIPAVCQYAHKAAGFVGSFLKEIPPSSLETSLYYI